MLSTTARPITRHEYALIPVGAPCYQLIEGDLGIKRSVYARTGVEELWIVDPAKRTVALYRLAENADTPAATYRAKQQFTSTLLPGLTIDLAAVFAT